jgi:uncharacterized protein (TIGR03000 family)
MMRRMRNPVTVPKTGPLPTLELILKRTTKGKSGTYQEEVAAPANLLVTLPADAKLFVDGHETTSTSGERLLTTPDLEPGREFHYTLRVEVTRDGQTQQVSQRVAVRAGEDVRVNIDVPTAVASR